MISIGTGTGAVNTLKCECGEVFKLYARTPKKREDAVLCVDARNGNVEDYMRKRTVTFWCERRLPRGTFFLDSTITSLAMVRDHFELESSCGIAGCLAQGSINQRSIPLPSYMVATHL
jgi:hypothetical protein